MQKKDPMQFLNVTMIWKAKPCILLSGIRMDWSFTGKFRNPPQTKINLVKRTMLTPNLTNYRNIELYEVNSYNNST